MNTGLSEHLLSFDFTYHATSLSLLATLTPNMNTTVTKIVFKYRSRYRYFAFSTEAASSVCLLLVKVQKTIFYTHVHEDVDKTAIIVSSPS